MSRTTKGDPSDAIPLHSPHCGKNRRMFFRLTIRPICPSATRTRKNPGSLVNDVSKPMYLLSCDQRGQQIPCEPTTWVRARVFRSNNMIFADPRLFEAGNTPNISAFPSFDQLGSSS